MIRRTVDRDTLNRVITYRIKPGDAPLIPLPDSGHPDSLETHIVQVTLSRSPAGDGYTPVSVRVVLIGPVVRSTDPDYTWATIMMFGHDPDLDRPMSEAPEWVRDMIVGLEIQP